MKLRNIKFKNGEFSSVIYELPVYSLEEVLNIVKNAEYEFIKYRSAVDEETGCTVVGIETSKIVQDEEGTIYREYRRYFYSTEKQISGGN